MREMPFLIFDDRKASNKQSSSKMLMPSNYLNMNLMNVHSVNNSKMQMPFTRDYRMRPQQQQQQRDKFMTAAFNHPPPPLATQKALAMMEYEIGNDLVLNNSKAYYKSELNGDRRRR
jgi:hypothetical protein